jgi:hypothetical protein
VGACPYSVPLDESNLLAGIRPQEMVNAFKPDFIAPIVGYLASECKPARIFRLSDRRLLILIIIANTDTTGRLFEIMGGWAAETRWQRAGGVGFPVNKISPEAVIAKWNVITNFSVSFDIRLFAHSDGDITQTMDVRQIPPVHRRLFSRFVKSVFGLSTLH